MFLPDVGDGGPGELLVAGLELTGSASKHKLNSLKTLNVMVTWYKQLHHHSCMCVCVLPVLAAEGLTD